MFGQTNATNGSSPTPNRPSASEVARIDTLLTHVLVSPERTDGLQVFQNARPLPPGSLESLSITITAPDADGRNGGITGVMSLYSGSGSISAGSSAPPPPPSQTSTPIFPGTVEVLARNRRIIVTCLNEDSFDGLWLGLGMRSDGTSAELTGVQSLRIVITPTLIDARLVWSEDGMEEDLLPEG